MMAICHVLIAICMASLGVVWTSGEEKKRGCPGDGNSTWHLCPLYDDYEHSVLFYLYTKHNPKIYQRLHINDGKTLKRSNFNKRRETQVVIHGWDSDSQGNHVISQVIKDAFLTKGDYNVILVDWSAYAEACGYIYDAYKVDDIGAYVGDFVHFLIQYGLPPSKVQIVGHSLGAHVTGFAGKKLKRLGKKIPRITGLDPAGPFRWAGKYDPSSGIAQGDADFVQIIHTDGGCFGLMAKIGDADFYPNGGEFQPGCWTWLGAYQMSVRHSRTEPPAVRGIPCSHSLAWEYYAESIAKEHHFYVELKCEIIVEKPINCTKVKRERGSQMGYYASSKLKGSYYLTTNEVPPYSKN